MSELLDEIMVPGSPNAQPCILMGNLAGKRWVLEEGCLRTALDLYQPTAPRGRAVKAALPLASGIGAFRSVAGLSRDERALTPAVAGLADELFGSGWSVSAFGGTPGDDQKVTLQFDRGGSVLGYIKVTDQKRILDLFVLEGDRLSFLEAREVNGVPRCLFVGERSGYGCFAQTCVKSRGYRVPTRLGRAHWDFLRQLCDKTSVHADFEETDASKTLSDLEVSCRRLPARQRATVLAAIDDVRDGMRGSGAFCFAHGDFTPWNTAFNKGAISAFDFEYARESYPPFVDAMHFFSQAQLFVRHGRASDIALAFPRFAREFEKGATGDPRLVMRFYLLSMIELFLRRKELGDVEAANMDTRIELLGLI